MRPSARCVVGFSLRRAAIPAVQLKPARHPAAGPDRTMPSTRHLSLTSVAVLTAVVGTTLGTEKTLTDYQWRPFAPVVRPTVPAGEPNPVDAFLTAARRERGLTARPEATKHVLLRRVFLDLIGLPPTRADLDAFLADNSLDAYEKVVDRLLASPQYGERWGRHWMDVWRYSDWAGYGKEVRESLPHIWQWRDWIIESLNADKAYDQMVREMLAGDEIAPTDPATLRATGYLARNSYIFNRNVVLDNMVEHTAKAFLGLTLNCARCHDHMYDPIAQTEYYSFRAIFEPCLARTDRVPGHIDPKELGLPRIYDAQPDTKTYMFVRGNEQSPDKDKLCPPAVPPALAGPSFTITPVKLPRDAYQPERRPFVIAEDRAEARRLIGSAEDQARTAQLDLVRAEVQALRPGSWEIVTVAPTLPVAVQKIQRSRLEVQARQAQYAALEATLAGEALEATGTLHTPEGERVAELAVIAQRQRALADARVGLIAAETISSKAAKTVKEQKLAEAKAALAKAETDAAATLHTVFDRRPQAKEYPQTSTGRRLALAKWITDRQNPLAARVAVNHVWARHFGRPLVPTVFDFGKNGRPPAHPALLDWLAAEFMESGWSLKHLHRVLVTSQAYRMDSHTDSASAAQDPDNVFLWRMPSRRMEAEVVRDSVLALSGRLDPTLGGPELDQNAGLTTFRRSVYYRHANEKQVPFLMIFDAASANECYQRPSSIVPQQALALANSPLTREASKLLANSLGDEAGSDDAAFIGVAFLKLLNRPPTEDESRECAIFLSGRPNARESLIHVLFNHHDFVTVH
jgi:hypothetical protein